MDLGLRGKIALITGGSSGIGEAVALALAAEGTRIAVAARRKDDLDRVVAEARKAGADDAAAFVFDLNEPSSVEYLLAEVRREMGARRRDPQRQRRQDVHATRSAVDDAYRTRCAR